MEIIKRKISRILLLVFLALSNFILKARTIDYDVERLNYSGAESNRLQRIINAANAFDIIEFKSASYNFENNSVKIDKPLELKGALGAGWNAKNKGAIAVETKFINTRRIDVRSNNVTLSNLDIRAANNSSVIMIDVRHPNFIDKTGDLGAYYSNFNMKNCFVRGAANEGSVYNIFAGNGFSGTINQVTFEAFTFAAINFDRKGRVNTFPKIVIDKCIFTAREPVGFNDWAVSFDAGNEDYPYVWDANDSQIKNSVFRNTGIALSKVQNVSITGNVFNHTKDFDIQQIHMEEYTRNIVATNNTFNCNTPSGITRVFGLDVEHQTIDNIKLNNNFIKGKFKLAVTSYSLTNLEFKNNTFGNTAECTSNFPLSFTFSGSKFLGQDPGDIPCSNMVITGNVGLTKPSIARSNGKVLDIFLESGMKGLTTDLPSSFIRKKSVGKGPDAKIADGIYFIENVQGRMQDPSNHPKIVGTTLTGDFVKWAIERVTPYCYSIRNLGSGQYLEALEVFKDSDICNGGTGNYKPLAESKYFDETPFSWAAPRPLWLLVKNDNGGWLIQPGSNEIKSTLSSNGVGNDAILVPRLKDGEPTKDACPRKLKDMNAFDPERKFVWKFIETGDSLNNDTVVLDDDRTSSIDIFPTRIKEDDPINIELGNLTTSAKVSVYDICGKLIYSTVTEDKSLIINRADISQSSGMFCLIKVKISSAEGKEQLVLFE